jgi:hypothetical protein
MIKKFIPQNEYKSETTFNRETCVYKEQQTIHLEHFTHGFKNAIPRATGLSDCVAINLWLILKVRFSKLKALNSHISTNTIISNLKINI